jgi:hypothetical protein
MNSVNNAGAMIVTNWVIQVRVELAVGNNAFEICSPTCSKRVCPSPLHVIDRKVEVAFRCPTESREGLASPQGLTNA